MPAHCLTFGSLFAGIGGFDLGFKRARMKCVWQVEIDHQCRLVLSTHFPDADLFDDVRECGRKNLERVDVVCGGFPCQDLSVAGKRAGLEGKSSGLFYEMARIVRELRPSLLVFENVPGLLSSDSGRDFARVLFHLGECGYFGAWRVLDTQFFGAPQRRRRVFGVFARGRAGAGCAAEILALSESVQGHSAASRTKGEGDSGTLGGGAGSRGWCDDLDQATFVARCLTAGEGKRQDGESVNFVVSTLQSRQHSPSVSAPGRGVEDDANLICFQQNQRDEVRDLGDKVGAITSQPGMKQQNYIAKTLKAAGHDASEDGTGRGVPLVSQPLLSNVFNNSDPAMEATMHIQQGMSVRRLTPVECCRLQSFPDNWLDIDPPLSDSAKYRMLGNAVTVNVAEWIGRRIVAASEII